MRRVLALILTLLAAPVYAQQRTPPIIQDPQTIPLWEGKPRVHWATPPPTFQR
jgi:hypothetical protein